MKTMVVVQDNYPGLLAEVTSLLADKGIKLKDVSGHTVGHTAVINIEVEPYSGGFRLLSKAGYHVYASETLLIRLEKEPGALAKVSRQLADAGIDVRGLHIVNKGHGSAIVAIETADQQRAKQVLKGILVSHT